MVRVREPFETVIIKNGEEVERSKEVGDVFYCDDCNTKIKGDRWPSEKRECYLCGKDLCEDHRHKYPSDDAPKDRFEGIDRVICERCKTKFAKELTEYTNYLITLEKLKDGLNIFAKTFGEKRVDHWDYSLPSYHRILSRSVREEQERKNANTKRNRERKFKQG